MPEQQVDSRDEMLLMHEALEHERELLKFQAESLRTFYSLTGPSRKNYVEQISEADAARLKSLGEARATNILLISRAQADGIKLIAEALSASPNPQLALEFARLQTLERVAQALADGKASKIYVPQDLGGLFSLLEGIGGAGKGQRAAGAGVAYGGGVAAAEGA